VGTIQSVKKSCNPVVQIGSYRVKVMSAKEILLEVAEKLPPDATLVDAIYELEFRQAVEEGLASLDRGERIPLEEARKRIPQWISKYSSPTTH
jgi:predicted transcriptional regulator